jgi:uncharacterized phage protein (TIGR02218 family)
MSIAAGELTSMAMCWRLERTDGAGLALTSHDATVECDGILHGAEPGMLPSAIKRSLGLEPHSAEASGALSADALDETDLALGRWDGAQVRLDAADWQQPGAEPISLLAGEIGNVAIDGTGFTTDLQGASAKLQQPVCPATSATCRAMFGDQQCRVDLAGRMIRATILSSDGGSLTLDTSVDDRFLLGRVRYLSGANCGLSTIILASSGTGVQVRDLPRAAVEAGCRIELREGCDKTFATCAGRFSNAVNFRGEPHLPGNDSLTRYPGA